MNDIKVKICGIKRECDIEMCMDLGVDILGIVTEYPVCVPWNLSQTEALPLLRKIRVPHRSCIVTGGNPQKVIELAVSLRPNMVQLHYNETLADTIVISDELKKLNIEVIKTVPQKTEDRIFQFGTSDIDTILDSLCKTNVYALLVDSRVPSNASLKGSKLDLEFCTQIIKLSSKPVIVAGGINVCNARNIVEQTGAGYIDIMTGVETAPGKKDYSLLHNLLSALK